jgi:hypothetical protein
VIREKKAFRIRKVGQGFRMGILGAILVGCFGVISNAWARPEAQTLALPFEHQVIFEGSIPGQVEERVVAGGKVEGETADFQQTGKPDLVIPWKKVQAILPILPAEDSGASVENLRAAMKVLQANRADWPKRTEVSEGTLQKWQERIDGILRRQEDGRRKKQEEEETKIRQAAREQAEAEIVAKEAEKSRLIDLAKGMVANYQGFRIRQEIEEASQACDKLEKSDLAKIPDYEKASDFWKRCLALPADVAMPGGLEGQKELSVKLAIDPSAHGSALTASAWVLFLVPLMVALHGLTRFLALLQERAWVGAGLWLGIGAAAGICLFLLFFSERVSGVEVGSGANAETREVWVALANVKEKEVTRFAEKIEIPSRIFLQKIVGSMKNPEVGSTAWVPTLTRLPVIVGDSGIEIGVEVPLKWISLPVRVAFAGPLPDQEISLKVTGGKIGPFSVGAGGGAWIWEQIVPTYQGVVTGLGLDQGVRLILLNSEKVVVSIPEIRAKLKPSP